MSHLHQFFSDSPDIIPSFADRDIFARYTGVGVGHQAQYCPPASLNQKTHSSNSTGIQDELPAAADEYSDEDDSYASNDGGDPPSASADEESEDNDGYDGAQDSEPDEDVMDEDAWNDEDEDGNNDAAFKF